MLWEPQLLENQQDSSTKRTDLHLHNQENYKASKHLIQTYHLVPNVIVGYSKITILQKELCHIETHKAKGNSKSVSIPKKCPNH